LDKLETIKQLNAVINALKTIPVKNDHVYTMVGVRNTLNGIIENINSDGGE
jgi:hypothetical protein